MVEDLKNPMSCLMGTKKSILEIEELKVHFKQILFLFFKKCAHLERETYIILLIIQCTPVYTTRPLDSLLH